MNKDLASEVVLLGSGVVIALSVVLTLIAALNRADVRVVAHRIRRY